MGTYGSINKALELINDILYEITVEPSIDVVILGDINIYLSKQDNKSKDYLHTLKSSGLDQYINTPTRITNLSATIIDHFWNNRPDLSSQHGILYANIADHRLVFCARQKIKLKQLITYIWARSYYRYNQLLFLDDINRTDWSSIYNSRDIEECVDMFYNILNRVIEHHAPFKWIHCRNRKLPWVSNELLGQIDNRFSTKTIMQKTGIGAMRPLSL